MPTQLEATSSLTYAQKGRSISVETALGPDALRERSLAAGVENRL